MLTSCLASWCLLGPAAAARRRTWRHSVGSGTACAKLLRDKAALLWFAQVEARAAQQRNLSTNPATLRRPLVTYLVDSIATTPPRRAPLCKALLDGKIMRLCPRDREPTKNRE